MGFTRVYLDEDSGGERLAAALRRFGFDVLSTVEAGREADPDERQLEFAFAERRVIITANQRDFSALQSEWGRLGRPHAGIIVHRQVGQSPEALAEAIFEFASSLALGAFDNAIVNL